MDKTYDKITCHDCGRTMRNKEEVMGYEFNGEDYFKCKKCHKSEPLLKPQECEVYSRVVGYIRPVKQFNPGKQEEYKDRKEFKV